MGFASWRALHGGYEHRQKTPLLKAGNCPLKSLFSISTKNIYDDTIEVRFVDRIRGEATFPSVEALVKQMHKDVAEVRTILEKNGEVSSQ